MDVLTFIFLTVIATVYAGCTVKSPACYVDVPSRILDPVDQAPVGFGLTLEYCAQICHDKGYTSGLAGVECGNECYCGSKIASGATPTDMSNCSWGCSANISEQCGGIWRINVFAVDCAGEPVPSPPQPPLRY